MHRFLTLGTLLLGAALIVPVAMGANQPQDKRYYDRGNKDYHVWNSQEDKAYRSYLGEQHRDYVEFGRNNRNQQTEYFKWRHAHPDNTLFKVEIK